MSEIFRSSNLVVRRRAPHGSTRMVVTFAPWRTDPSLDHPGFGADFCEGHGLDAIHVTCAGNDWYQYPEMEEAYAAIRAAAEGYGTVVTYGVSMGGYQAIKAAARIAARRVVAISPQVSVDPRKVPFETRWEEPARLTYIDDEIVVQPGCRYAVVFDPRSPLDAAHARLIEKALGGGQMLPMPFAGHFILQTWKDAGCISKATLTLLKSKRDTAGVRGVFRQARAGSAQYLGALLASGRLTPEAEARLTERIAALQDDGA